MANARQSHDELIRRICRQDHIDGDGVVSHIQITMPQGCREKPQEKRIIADEFSDVDVDLDADCRLQVTIIVDETDLGFAVKGGDAQKADLIFDNSVIPRCGAAANVNFTGRWRHNQTGDDGEPPSGSGRGHLHARFKRTAGGCVELCFEFSQGRVIFARQNPAILRHSKSGSEKLDESGGSCDEGTDDPVVLALDVRKRGNEPDARRKGVIASTWLSIHGDERQLTAGVDDRQNSLDEVSDRKFPLFSAEQFLSEPRRLPRAPARPPCRDLLKVRARREPGERPSPCPCPSDRHPLKRHHRHRIHGHRMPHCHLHHHH